MKSFWQVFMASMVALSLVVPTTTAAASSKTYSFNVSAATNYTTIGISFSANHAATSWYSPDWKYRQKITINKDYIGEELTDFPIVIRLGDQSLTGARDDRQDLVFTASDGVTKLAHEREDDTTMWVKIPTLTPTNDTVLYVYYGNQNSEDQQHPADVWTSQYAAVYHMSQDPAGTTKDSTKNAHDSTSSGGMNKEALIAGRVGKAFDFDGDDDRITVPGNMLFTGQNQGTVSAWAKSDTTNTGSGSRAVYTDNASNGVAHSLDMSGGNIRFYLRQSSGTFRILTTPLEANHYYHIVGSYDTAALRLKLTIDGIERATNTAWDGTFYAFGSAGSFSTIGDHSNAGTFTWDGPIDEVHIATVVRSGAWLKAEYANQSNTENFLTIADTIESSTGTSSLTLKPTKALPFSSLSKITADDSSAFSYQLSPDAGTTWYYYASTSSAQAPRWTKTSATTPEKASSLNDINGHLATFPHGTGKLLWRVFVDPGATLDTIKIDYTANSSSSSDTPSGGLVSFIDSLFKLVYQKNITPTEHDYWVARVSKGEKPTLPELYGALQWQKLFKK